MHGGSFSSKNEITVLRGVLTAIARDSSRSQAGGFIFSSLVGVYLDDVVDLFRSKKSHRKQLRIEHIKCAVASFDRLNKDPKETCALFQRASEKTIVLLDIAEISGLNSEKYVSE